MPRKIKATKRQQMLLLLHAIGFTIGVILMWTLYKGGSKEWVYPWPAWITAAWGLWLVGHFCVTYFSYEDKGLKEYKRQESNA